MFKRIMAIVRGLTAARLRRPGRVVLLLAAGGLLGTARGRATAQDVPFSDPAPGRIVYTRQAADAFDIYTSDPDGTHELRLSDIDESAAGEDQPRWSPDGRRVAFTTFPDSLASICIIAAEGGPVRKVVERDGTSGDPAWSPDGRCLVYDGGQGTSEDDQKRFDLKIWCDDGPPTGTVRRLTNTPDIDEREPDWSVDGTIVFTAKSNKQNATDRWELWRINADGTGRAPLIDLPDTHERQPRFSVDGGRVAFITSRQPFSFGTLAVVDLAGGSVERYAEGPSDTLTWSPDGTEILFANIFRGGVRPIAPGALAERAPLLSAGAAAVRQGGTQYAGLYRIALAARRLTRLHGAAGGSTAPNASTNFEFGYMPDWSPGTATPTPDATATPTASNTPTATATATSTLEPTPTPPRIYLPDVRYEAPPTEAPTATITPTAAPTDEPTAGPTWTAVP